MSETQGDEEFDGFIPQSESKLNYSGTKDHPGEVYVDHDEPTLFDKREERAEQTERWLTRMTRWTRWGSQRYG